MEEEEAVRRDAQEYATMMWEQERAERIAEHEEQGHIKQGAARRSRLLSCYIIILFQFFFWFVCLVRLFIFFTFVSACAYFYLLVFIKEKQK